MVLFCNCIVADSVAGAIGDRIGGCIYAAVTGQRGEGIYQRISDTDGTFCHYTGGGISGADFRGHSGICGGSADGPV